MHIKEMLTPTKGMMAAAEGDINPSANYGKFHAFVKKLLRKIIVIIANNVTNWLICARNLKEA